MSLTLSSPGAGRPLLTALSRAVLLAGLVALVLFLLFGGDGNGSRGLTGDAAAPLMDGLRGTVPAMAAATVAAPAAAEPAWYVAVLTPRNLLLVLHLLGIAIGFGSTLILDGMLLFWMAKGRLDEALVPVFKVLAVAVSGGLALLWASGLGFLGLYAATDPDKLGNEKLFSKIGIVYLLTINGVALHSKIMPMALERLSMPPLTGLSRPARLVALACGALSAASWVTSFLLGALRELNGRIGVGEVAAVWLAMILAFFLLANLLLGRRGLAAHFARRS